MALLGGVDSWTPNFTSVVLGLLTLFAALRYLSGRKIHPNEPTVLPPWIPFIGHLLGMALQGGRYIKRLGLSHPNEPILTLPVPGSRLYIVTEPSLAASVQRNSKAMSFTPLVPDITKRVLGLDDKSVELVRQNLDPGPGDPRGFLADMHDMVYNSLGPGQYLNVLSQDAAQELCDELHDHASSLQAASGPAEPVDLLNWIRQFVTVGTARYLFGPHNPIDEDPGLMDEFWNFDHGLGGLLMGIVPSLTAAKAYRGREKVVVALKKYYAAGHEKTASQIIQDRTSIEKEYDMSLETISRSALSFLFAGIVNTTTTTFWVVLRLYADQKLLETVRGEIQEALKASEEQVGPDSLSITQVKDKCSTLQAVYRESMRIGSENFSVRLIKEDVMLADRYFLKKGAVVQIAGGVIHADKSIWGDDVENFNPHRFLTQKARGGGIHPAAFRGFGGGKTLCPGRHFATNEILLFAAMIVLGFDMTAPDGGRIRVPEKNDRVMPVHILEPHSKECPKVVVKSREQVEMLGRLQIVT